MKKKTVVMLVGAAALACALAIPVKVFSNNFDVNVNMGGGGYGHHHHHGFAHPEIDAAISHLNQAQSNLMNAAHDYDGHRVRALQAVNNALKQCQMAIHYADTHDR